MVHHFRAQLRADLVVKGLPFLFVSKAGAAGQPGTPDAPLNHPDAAAALASPYTGGIGQGTYPGANPDGNHIIVIGSGEYQGQHQASSNLLVADGAVVWNVDGDLLLGTKWDGYLERVVEGITFRRIHRWRPNYSGGGYSYVAPAVYRFCTLDFVGGSVPNVFFFGDTGYIEMPYNLNDCVVRNLHGTAGSFVHSLLFHTQALDCWQLLNCYVDKYSFIELRNEQVLASSNGQGVFFGNANIEGKIRIKGDVHGYTSLDDFKIHYNLTDRADLFDAAPQFSSVTAEDFSLRDDSPHHVLGIGPAPLRQAASVLLEGPTGVVSATSGHAFHDPSSGFVLPLIEAHNLVCVETGGRKYLRVQEAVGGPLEGWYKTGLHFVADTSQEIVRVNFLGGLHFDTDLPTAETLFDPNAPEPSNTNVPSATPFATGAAGRNPHRLDFLLRWGNKPTPDPTLDTDFANGGQYLAFEWFSDLLYNPVTLTGTGAPEFDPAATGTNAPRHPQALYLQYVVKLRNNFYSH